MVSSREVGRRADALSWIKKAAIKLSAINQGVERTDLVALGELIGEATVVALGEAVHGALEPLEFRNQLFQYLVQEKGFTAIAIESGIVEGREVHDFALGGSGDLRSLMPRGFSWTFDRYVSNCRLVQWIRDYNAEARHSPKIRFYGFDVPGSPNNASAVSGPEVALLATLAYLTKVDRHAAETFHARLDAFLGMLRFDFQRSSNRNGYDSLTVAERDTLTSAISDLIALLERQEAPYAIRSSVTDYEWAYRAAIGARQTDGWLRQIPADWRRAAGPVKFPSKETEFVAEATEVRDRGQADNLDWIIRREGADGKVLVYASRFHLSSAPVVTAWSGSREQQVAGTYLRRRLAKKLISIGNLVGEGEVNLEGVKHFLAPPRAGSLDELACESGIAHFLLDLRTAPKAVVAAWFAQRHPLGWDGLDLSPSPAFDVLWFLRRVTPA
jgi:erythromycin esterase